MPTEAPPAPPPAATPSQAAPPAETPTERPPSEWLGDIASDFGEMDAGRPEPSRARDDKGKFKPTEKQVEKPAAKQPDKPEEKAEEKPPETPPEEKPPETPKPVRAAELRNAYEGLKKKVKEELEPEVQRLRAKVQEYETKAPQDNEPLLQKIKSIEARNAELEKHMAFVDYTQSTEFNTKYREPYKQAWTDAVAEFRELTVREPDGEDEAGEPKFKVRPADENDLLRLANLKLSDMDNAATQMFGASAPRAIGHIQNIKRLSAAQRKALAEAKTKAEEWKTQSTTQFQQKAKMLADTWHAVHKSLEEKFPKAFKPEEGDADDKAAHTKGFALADLMFLGPESLSPEQVDALPTIFKDTLKANKPLTEPQKVQLHALARLKMANHDRKIIALKKAQDRIKELEKSLAEYEKSEPSAERAGAAEGKVSSKDWLETTADELRALDK